eukprot:scaffold314351_cov37-Prasinocladus_malaysianus.AAC.1
MTISKVGWDWPCTFPVILGPDPLAELLKSEPLDQQWQYANNLRKRGCFNKSKSHEVIGFWFSHKFTHQSTGKQHQVN